MKTILKLLMCLSLFTGFSMAQDDGDQMIAVGFDVGGIAVKRYAGNVEVLLAGRHGLLAEGGAVVDGTFMNFGYRFHFKEGMASRYLQPFFKMRFGGDTVTDSGITYTYKTKAFYPGLSYGRRWVWGPGFTMNWRLGYGHPLVTIESDGDLELTDEATELVETIYGILTAIDYEWSVGWAF